MNRSALLLRFFPVLVFACLISLAFLLNFNGLYGQDAHEYVRQSRLIYAALSGEEATGFSSEFGFGYPLLGALLQFIISDAALVLQLLSAFSLAISVYFMDKLVGLLTPGSQANSRLWFIVLGVGLAPALLRSGLLVMSDGLGLSLTLVAFFYGLRYVERGRGYDSIWAAVWTIAALSVRIALAGLLLPLAVVIGYHLWQRAQWRWLLYALLAGAVCVLPHILLETSPLLHPGAHSNLHWSVEHFFQRSFQFENGLAAYRFPNLVYLGFPLLHPAFCVLLPGLFFLVKRTDFLLPAKKTILFGLFGYGLLLGGLPHQNIRFLIPAYALLLLLFFPAWDRFFCYGLHYVQRGTQGLIGFLLLLQLFFTVRMLSPTLSRSQLERQVATALRADLPANATLYGFDLDIAMHSYLPDLKIRNLWEQRYDTFPAGTYVLFNAPALERQWTGQNPMLNWEFLQVNYHLELLRELPEGWGLFQVGEPIAPDTTPN